MASRKASRYEARIKGTRLCLLAFPMRDVNAQVMEELAGAGYDEGRAGTIAPYAWYHSCLEVRTEPMEFLGKRLPKEVLIALGEGNVEIVELTGDEASAYEEDIDNDYDDEEDC